MRSIIGIALLLWSSSSLAACKYTIASYVETDLHVRQLTVDGMKDRLAMISAGRTGTVEYRADEATQQQIAAVLSAGGCTATDYYNFGTRNAQAIEVWYGEHGDRRQMRDNIAQMFTFYSNQLSRSAR